MNTKTENPGAQFWFVGASYGEDGDQTERFLTDGTWENGYTDRYLDLVRAMRAGDRIAIKASYTRKHDLPFDSRGHTVSVMAIKAVGKIVENLNDGRRVRVEWTRVEPPREWYFFTHRGTVWRVIPGDWHADGLIGFAFDNQPQDIQRFCNAPHWRERFGTKPVGKSDRFAWTSFYEAVASALLKHRTDRGPLVAFIGDMSRRLPGMGYLRSDRYADGKIGFVRDICPFTAMGLFNRGVTTENRRAIAKELATFLGVTEKVPETFDGVPLLFQMKSWFFPKEAVRKPDHIDALWRVFAAGIEFADAEDDPARIEFVQAFDDAMCRPLVGWNLTIGLYWSQPWVFASLDKNSRSYITEQLRMPISTSGPDKRCSAADYIALVGKLRMRFEEADYPVHSFPELSLEAWRHKVVSGTSEEDVELQDGEDGETGYEKTVEEVHQTVVPPPPPIIPFTVKDIVSDGCFLSLVEIEGILARVRDKKNLILQGPPGTGKTWLAKRLAFALLGARDESKVRVVQFHPNLSYEDFVRGWRPIGEGRLALVDGAFMEVISAALKEPGAKYVVVIEEINRGSPAQIFGELLTLLEAGKRTPKDAVELCYADADGKRRPVHIPENIFVIGTMNIADRSLALVDLALRRRFAFVGLEPRLGEAWRRWVVDACKMDPDGAKDIETRLTKLNERIAGDTRLGKQFRIGHSYVTPTRALEEGETADWFRQVAQTEILPLLEEYWFDAPGEAQKAFETLMQDW
ncbi:AAA domain-containing protein [Rhodoplanes serenus]|uniref:AAA domain-containing protein n=1 Tax=Rhodoplanes serenus TaxID=200615 RepID=A0A9X4XNC9_9BRAD|nr:AAA family ATPase [Rhodoplanes serenus]MTW18370.1 AAA domain-containing protein [Rhodoplanes serenus]